MNMVKFQFKKCFLNVLTGQDGSLWFVAKDVCGVLGYRDTNDGTRYLDSDEVATCPDNSSGQVRNVKIINEPGLYSLILRSRKPEAKKFKRWVTHSVLPAIRKTGGYIHGGDEPSLKNIAALVKYVQDAGIDVKKSKIYKDVKRNLIVKNADKTIDIQEAKRYIEYLIHSGRPQYNPVVPYEIALKYRSIASQHLAIKSIYDSSFKLAKSIGYSKADASKIAQNNVLETTGIDLYSCLNIERSQPNGASSTQILPARQLKPSSQNSDSDWISDDLIEDFIDDCCILGDDFKASLNVLYEKFINWFDRYISKKDVPPKNFFGEKLSEIVDKTEHFGIIYHGIKVR
jgi:prophage antirepressor-like protein